MKIANIYNHLNGLEFMKVNKPLLFGEIEAAISTIDANLYVKESRDQTKTGKQIYNQRLINKRFQDILVPQNWKEKRVKYYVASDIETTREVTVIKDESEQKSHIEARGGKPLVAFNQVDFVKERVAVEVQFGKYAFVAYDLHVKHTFFFLRDEIDVGIEIIPTHKMMQKMDTGIAWFENEVANVIREGRANLAVPLIIIGIEPEQIKI